MAVQPNCPGDSEYDSDPVDDLIQFTHTIRLRCIDPATNRNRIYTLTWQRDLWGALTLVQRWGRWPRPSRSLAITYAGVIFKVTVPGAGAVFLDVGRIVLDLESGEFTFMAGPHQFFDGDFDALCAALAGEP